MASNLTLYDDTGTTILTSLPVDGNDAGEPSPVVTTRVVNDNTSGPVDIATDGAIALKQDDGAGGAISRGLRAIDEGWIEVKLTGNASSGVQAIPTGWVPLRGGVELWLPELEGGEWVEVEWQDARPANAPAGQVLFTVILDGGRMSVALELGHTDAGQDGVLTGLGDDTWFELLSGGEVTPQGTPDNTFHVGDRVFRNADGGLAVALEEDVATDGNDGDSVALDPDESYWLIASVAADGSVTKTKSSKAADPIPVSLVPAVPVGEAPLARILRSYDGVIETTDISSLRTVGGFDLSASGLTLSVGPGRSLTGNALVRRTATTVLGASPSSSVWLWVLRNGRIELTTTSARPDPLARLIWQGEAGASSMDSLTDRRVWVGGRMELLRFDFAGTPDVAPDAFLDWPFNREGWVWPFGAQLTAHTPGSGNAAGQTRAELFHDPDGTGWVTLFTSKASDDRRWVMDWDGEPISKLAAGGLAALPEVVQIPAGSRLKAEIEEAVAYDATAPSGFTLTVPIILV